MSPVLGSCGPHNKVQLPGWFETKEMSSLIVLEAGSQKSRCLQGHGTSAGSGGNLSHALFLPSVARNLWYSLACRSSLQCLSCDCRASSCLSLFIHLCSSHRDTSHTGWGSTQIEYNLILITFARPYVQIRAHLQVPEFSTSIYYFGDTNQSMTALFIIVPSPLL